MERVGCSSAAGLSGSPAAAPLEAIEPRQEGRSKAIADLRKEIDRDCDPEHLRRPLGLDRRTVEVVRRTCVRIAGQYQAEARRLSPEEVCLAYGGHVLLAVPSRELARGRQRRRIRKIGCASGNLAAKRQKLHAVSHEWLPVREFRNGAAMIPVAVSSEADA